MCNAMQLVSGVWWYGQLLRFQVFVGRDTALVQHGRRLVAGFVVRRCFATATG
jgi:hypothetical protein